MKKLTGGIMALTLVFTFHCQHDLTAQSKNRADIPDKEKWKLEDLYASDDAWQKAKTDIAGQFDDVLKFKGKLSSSPHVLLDCLEFNSALAKTFGRLYNYASMKSDEDTRNSTYQAMKQELRHLLTEFGSKAAFIEPEIVAMDKSTIDMFIEKEAKLADYKFYLYDLQRTKAHTLSEKEEKILAESGLMASTPQSIFGIFYNAELPYPEVTLSDGETVRLDPAGYSRYRAVPNRDDREKVFTAFFTKLGEFKGTFGEQLYGQIKKDIFYTRTRNYENCLASSLDQNNIPPAVYHSLIKNVNDNLDSFHRYLRLKKRMLGVDTLKYSDLYAPTVKGVELEYSYEKAQQLVLDALKPLGKDYVKVVKQAFSDRWIDVRPTMAKRSGAYSNGNAYDVHPYILLNYNGQYDDVSTLAHELGHTMHSYYSNKNQPFPTADYSIFVAEVASTLNEALLKHKMLRDIKDDDVRLSLLMNILDNLKGTLFRQTQFAEFELRIHEQAEAGEPLTGDNLTSLYADILKKYYGQEKGVCYIDDVVNVEWAYIPHFYYNFYVYQYSTSFTASTALAEKIINKEKSAVEKYLAFISSGGSDYPIELLKKAGVDMTTSEPFDKTIVAMNRTIDEIEKILDKKNK